MTIICAVFTEGKCAQKVISPMVLIILKKCLLNVCLQSAQLILLSGKPP